MKKTKVAALLMALCLTFAPITACKVVDDDDNPRHTSRSNETRESRETSRRHHSVTTPDYLNGGQTWFDAHGLHTTRTGTFGMKVYSSTLSSTGSGNVVELDSDISIREDFEGCEPGYKNVIATLVIYTSYSADVHYWTSTFDLYTGRSFEHQNGSNSIYNGCQIHNEGEVPLQIGNYNYTIGIQEDITEAEDVTTLVYTIHCPEEYDGVVFQYGYYSGTGDQYYDFDNNIYYADDFTDVSSGLYDYFTIERRPLVVD